MTGNAVGLALPVHGADACHRVSAGKTLERAAHDLNARQRAWLAKGIRDWATTSPDPPTVVLDANLVLAANAIDLGEYLSARQRERRRVAGRMAGRRTHVLPEWLRNWLPEVIPALAAGLGTSAVLSSLAELPPRVVWVFRSARNTELARLIERLADTIFPNAPTVVGPTSRPTNHGGRAILSS